MVIEYCSLAWTIRRCGCSTLCIGGEISVASVDDVRDGIEKPQAMLAGCCLTWSESVWYRGGGVVDIYLRVGGSSIKVWARQSCDASAKRSYEQWARRGGGLSRNQLTRRTYTLRSVCNM